MFKFLIPFLLVLTVSAEQFTSIVSSTADCKTPKVVATLIKNDSLTATCAQILGGASITPNACSAIPGSVYGSLGCSNEKAVDFASSVFTKDTVFLGFLTYSPADTTCSTPLFGSFLVPDGTCVTPFWPGAFDVNPAKSYKVTYDAGTQTIGLKYYDLGNCSGTAVEKDIPSIGVDFCNNLSGTYAKVVKLVAGVYSNATQTKTSNTGPTTPTKNDAIIKSPFLLVVTIMSLCLMAFA